MNIHVEWTAGVMRLLVEDFGGPYVWSASVVRDGDRLIIKGVSAMPERPAELVAAIRAWCREHGVARVEWERKRRGRVVAHQI